EDFPFLPDHLTCAKTYVQFHTLHIRLQVQLVSMRRRSAVKARFDLLHPGPTVVVKSGRIEALQISDMQKFGNIRDQRRGPGKLKATLGVTVLKIGQVRITIKLGVDLIQAAAAAWNKGAKRTVGFLQELAPCTANPAVGGSPVLHRRL